jgi:hypothetical protein
MRIIAQKSKKSSNLISVGPNYVFVSLLKGVGCGVSIGLVVSF